MIVTTMKPHDVTEEGNQLHHGTNGYHSMNSLFSCFLKAYQGNRNRY